MAAKLYKYRSLRTAADLKRAREIIARSQVYFPAPSSFNDPFDCRPSYQLNISDEKLREHQHRIGRKFHPHWTDEQVNTWADNPYRDMRDPAFLGFMQDMSERQLTNGLGVLSVSALNNEILMWAHYSDCHTGICFEFDTAFEPFGSTRKVRYEIERIPVHLMEDDEATQAEKSVFLKANGWKYEDEWRKVRYEGPGAVHFDPRALTGIILGAKITHQNARRVIRWARRAPHAVLYEAIPHREKFEMRIVPIEREFLD